MSFKVEKSEDQWKEELTPEQYYVLRQKGTERPFTGEYTMHFENGVYKCAACDASLFDSEAKFDSHCGWPSFDRALEKNTVVEKLDTSHGMIRTEILCANCGSHLGHVFNDGPTETGMRYCINSVSLGFEKKKNA
ncbi:MAG TPA: peptide-methionine (R)-S-oxide reductase [Cryomorphaceae bacterium]|nr:peptide-methionine (R)-S-oxide reductase [Owenweeksia sp.]HAD96139.1 peptide-methionine (R)-S-oxide reductase [Cryomorphaceae bacterium]HBF18776.1 peptide-methionine (R)-S-oxide reductase [Cryomorphaceae bacterium]HCQ14943.1 peptide-methionine (R)-S-oxide reductase [Cryomorphaceae bacterium]|tara:strand:- start:311 stop:715 length:405 start_codon:yes stop_codon:yes gene_type:complete